MKNLKKKVMAIMAAMVIAVVPGSSMLTAEAAATPVFRDVPADHWAVSYIERAYEQGILNGTYVDEASGVREFSPESPVKVNEFYVMLGRMYYPNELAQWEYDNPDSSEYAIHGKWFVPAKNVLYKLGISQPTSSETPPVGVSSWTMPVSRLGMACAITELIETKGIALPSEAELNATAAMIPDLKLESYSERLPEPLRFRPHYDTTIARLEKAVKVVYHLGILTGMDDSGTFNGAGSMTRAQAAVILTRIQDVVGPPVANTWVEPEPEPEPVIVYGPVGTLSDAPVTLSLETHAPVVDYWSGLPRDLQEYADRDAYNCFVQTLRDMELQLFDSSGGLTHNPYYNYACLQVETEDLLNKEASRKGRVGKAFGLMTNGAQKFLGPMYPYDLDTVEFVWGAISEVGSNYTENPDVKNLIISQLKPGMTDKQKAEVCVKAVADRFEYGTGTFDWFGESRVGMCDSFSRATRAALSVAGIISIADADANHAWATAYLDGEWYVVDGVVQNAGRNGVMTFE